LSVVIRKNRQTCVLSIIPRQKLRPLWKASDLVSLPRMPPLSPHFAVEEGNGACLLRLRSEDGTNRLTRACVLALTEAFRQLRAAPKPLVVAGNQHFFSAGADLVEIAALTGADAFAFSRTGQALMNAIEQFPAPVYAAIEGYCMGGGLDLALACHRRIASPHTIFGHRGAALGLITGWGGTQRLPRLIGKARALEILVAAEKIPANVALRIGLADAIVTDPVHEALGRIMETGSPTPSR
jgi:enoyl-CoA hydratase/carnithine racemase